MLAHGRWMYHAALQRTESRGMHKRVDRPTQGDAGEVFPPVQALPDSTFGVARERRQEQQRACKDEGNPDRPTGSVQHGRGHFTPCEHEG